MNARNALAALSLAFTTISVAWAVPAYNIVPLGFSDLEHTRNDGYQFSYAYDHFFDMEPFQLNEEGKSFGHSTRYNGGSTNMGNSAWLYDGASTINIGLVGTEHTRNDGYKHSVIYEMNEPGQVRGISSRFDGDTELGQSLWVYDGVTTIDIGLTDPEHSRNDGYRLSDTYTPINKSGQVSGFAERYNGDSDLGYSAWFYNGTSTIEIGLTGPEHTRDDGAQSNSSFQLNDTGQVIGNATRFNGGSTSLGLSAWLYDGTNTFEIGLAGTEHTRNDGYIFHELRELNEAGQIVGRSQRFNGGSSELGYSAWLYNGATTINIGFTGAGFTRSNGFKDSQIAGLNEAGQVTGVSWHYNGGTFLGRRSWLYDGATTIEIGLIGVEHIRNDGYKDVAVGIPNQAGQAIGHSNRYNGGNIDLGISAWLYNGATTVDVGLIDAGHTSAGGGKYSTGYFLNEAGQVAGISAQFDSNGGGGQSAWLYDGTTTIEIGLTGAEYTNSTGSGRSEVLQLNEMGQVTGHTFRYDGGNDERGNDAWFYDPVSNQTLRLRLSTRSDGYADSTVEYLSDDGLAIGRYNLFDGADNDLGYRAFAFSLADGLHDLGALVDGGLTTNGWDFLADAVRANSQGQILGHGKLTSQSGGQMAYLLTPIVPEPSTLLLATLGVIGLLTRRRC